MGALSARWIVIAVVGTLSSGMVGVAILQGVRADLFETYRHHTSPRGAWIGCSHD